MSYVGLPARCCLFAAVFGTLLVLLPALGSADMQSEATDASPVVVCTPEHVSVFPAQTISVKVLAGTEEKEQRSYHWSSTGGHIEGRDSEAQWSFAGVKPGLYTAKVRISRPGNNSVECSVSVVVRPHPGERGVRETGGHFLVAREQEARGYGLYSYVLFGSMPEGAALERFTRTIESYLSLMPEITALAKYFSKNELNIAYTPVLKESPAAGDNPKERLTEQWVLKNYDLARARAILSKLGDDYRDGPYLLSFLSPPLTSATAPRPCLVMDLSKVPPDLIRAWMKHFLYQASQERFWEEKRMSTFVLRLRTGVEVVSTGYGVSKKAVSESIKLAP